jgi:hypothetical protein
MTPLSFRDADLVVFPRVGNGYNKSDSVCNWVHHTLLNVLNVDGRLIDLPRERVPLKQ